MNIFIYNSTVDQTKRQNKGRDNVNIILIIFRCVIVDVQVFQILEKN